MSTQSFPALVNTEVDFVVVQNNTEIVSFTISGGAIPYNLTGNTLTLYLKDSRTTPDNQAFTDYGVITAALLGEFAVTIPQLQTETAGSYWYRVDTATAVRTDSGGGTTLNSYTVVDASAVASDLGSPISGTNIPTGSAITAVNVGVGYTISSEATANASGLSFSVGGAISTLVFGAITILSV